MLMSNVAKSSTKSPYRLLMPCKPSTANPSPAIPPNKPIIAVSTRCCLNKSDFDAPTAKRKPISADLPVNLASNKPMVLSKHTSKNINESHIIILASSSTTSWRSIHCITLDKRFLSGRGKRPNSFCSIT